MAVQTVIDNPFIFRPDFTREELSLKSPKTNERRFVPFALVPHTVKGEFDSDECVLKFEYLIDETLGQKINPDSNISISIGKYTEKILEIVINHKGQRSFLSNLLQTEELLKTLRDGIEREPVKRNYDLVVEILQDISKDEEFIKICFE